MTALRLEYADLFVGTIRDAFQSDGTWFGRVDVALDPAGGALQARLIEFIAFGQMWNERVARGEPAEATGFERFSEVRSSVLWRTRASEETLSTIVNAPVFFRGDEVSWQSL